MILIWSVLICFSPIYVDLLPDEGWPEEVPDEYWEEEEEGVHDGELDQLLAEHSLPAQLPQLQLGLQPTDELVLSI